MSKICRHCAYWGAIAIPSRAMFRNPTVGFLFDAGRYFIQVGLWSGEPWQRAHYLASYATMRWYLGEDGVVWHDMYITAGGSV